MLSCNAVLEWDGRATLSAVAPTRFSIRSLQLLLPAPLPAPLPAAQHHPNGCLVGWQSLNKSNGVVLLRLWLWLDGEWLVGGRFGVLASCSCATRKRWGAVRLGTTLLRIINLVWIILCRGRVQNTTNNRPVPVNCQHWGRLAFEPDSDKLYF